MYFVHISALLIATDGTVRVKGCWLTLLSHIRVWVRGQSLEKHPMTSAVPGIGGNV